MVLGRAIVTGAVGLLIAACSPAADDKARLVTVSGEAEIRVAPDRADVGLGVEASEKTLAEAQRKVADGVGRLLALCDRLGIPRAQVSTAQLLVQPQYEQPGPNGGRPGIVGYLVSRQVEVDLRDLDKLGPLMQGAVEAGANRVTPPRFDASKKDEYQRQALAGAAEDARANATVLAQTLGVKLGPLHSLSADGAESPPQPMYRMALAAAPESGYEPGEVRFNARVTAQFQLAH